MIAEKVARLRVLADNAERASRSASDPGRAKGLARDAEAWRLIADCLDALETSVTS